jgi:hypothetical protein
MSDEMLNRDERADWPRCSHPECIGIAIPDRGGKCLAHLDEDDLSDVLKALSDSSIYMNGQRSTNRQK